MEGMYTELALYGSKNECARTDNVFFPISEVFNGTVSLVSCNCKDHMLVLEAMRSMKLGKV